MAQLRTNAVTAFRALLDLDNFAAEESLERLSAEELAQAHNAAYKLTALAAKVSANKQLREQLKAEADEKSWRDCAHRADYASPAEHSRECPEHGDGFDGVAAPGGDQA
jgi:hypothetical protein